MIDKTEMDDAVYRVRWHDFLLWVL